LIVCDLDDTLILRNVDLLEQLKVIRDFVNKLKQHSIPLVIATGRSVGYVDFLTKIVGAKWKNIPHVVENGCLLFYPYEHIIEKNPLINENVVKLRESLKNRLEKIIRKSGMRIEVGKLICITLKFVDGKKKFVNQKLASKVNKVVKEFGGFKVITTRKTIEVIPNGVDKGEAIKLLLKRLKVPKSEVLGVGDDNNDISFLNECGIRAGVGNCNDSLLSFIDYKAKKSGIWGIIEIFEKFF